MTSVPERDAPRPLDEHLAEMRRRLLVCLAATVVGMAALLPFAPTLFAWLMAPLAHALPGQRFAALSPFEAWSVYFRVAAIGGFLLATPVIAGQLFAFAAPALSRRARRRALAAGLAVGLLFVAGAAFCYHFVLPAAFSWAAAMTQEMGAVLLPSLERSLALALGLLLAFGLAFELPVAVAALAALGLVRPEALRRKRPHAIVGAFVVGAILTPPDVLSQTLLAIPLILLYELGLLLGTLLAPRRTAVMSA